MIEKIKRVLLVLLVFNLLFFSACTICKESKKYDSLPSDNSEIYNTESNSQINNSAIDKSSKGLSYEEKILSEAKIALSKGNYYKAKYLLNIIIEKKNDGLIKSEESKKNLAEVYYLLGLIFYDEKNFDGFLNVFETLIQGYISFVDIDKRVKAYLIASRLLYLKGKADNPKDMLLARFYFGKVDKTLLVGKDRKLYSLMSRLLKWQNINANALGLEDNNVAVVKFDGNDLWVGTWNGGLSRYNIFRGESDVFRSGAKSIVPKTVRAIEPTSSGVWVGSYDGLLYFSKRTGKWFYIDCFLRPKKIGVETLGRVGDTIYVGTMGEGLWQNSSPVLNREKWERVSGLEDLKFINCLVTYKDYLIIGTMDKGVFFFNTESREVVGLTSLCPEFSALNITTLLVEDSSNLWIGTYGKGLYNWNFKSNKLRFFSKENGFLPDNWVLSSGKNRNFLYFGTFGGGVVVFDRKQERFRVYGLEDGLDSLDISSIAVENNIVVFGTLGMGITLYFGEGD